MQLQTQTLVRGLITGLAISAAAVTMLPAPTAQAAAVATVGSSPSTGVKIVGTGGADKIVVTRAGTTSAPKVHVDADTPLGVRPAVRPSPVTRRGPCATCRWSTAS